MNLQQSSEEILNQLIHLLDKIDDQQYDSPVHALSQSSIGAHVRHIIEFYDCLIKGLQTGVVNYDNRKRNMLLETDRYFALQTLVHVIHHISHMKRDQALKINMDLSNTGMPIVIDTTYYRELAYNIEHAIHHMAIIRIGVQTAYPMVSVERNFGVAYATIRYKTQVCAQ